MMATKKRATSRYGKRAANCFTFIQLASIRLWLQINEFAA